MRTYLASIISSGVMLLAIAAAVILTGGWEAAAAAIAILAATVWVGCFLVILVGEDRLSPGRGPRAA